MNTIKKLTIPYYDLQHLSSSRLLANSSQSVAVGQRGSILVLATIGMVAMLGMAGLALDMGYLYLNKTRLQNAVDAAALSGAKTLDHLVIRDAGAQQQAFDDARTAFTANAGLDGNDVLNNIAENGVEVQFSANLQGGFANLPVDNPLFVRVTVIGENFTWPTWLIQVIPPLFRTTLGASASAVAGPSAVCPGNIVPMLACAQSNTNTTPGQFWGFTVNQDAATGFNIILDTKVSSKNQVSGGNFQLIDLGKGNVRQYFTSGINNSVCAGQNLDTVDTAPGGKVGQVSQGIADLIASDTISTTTPLTFSEYAALMEDTPNTPTPRIMHVPFVWCPDLKNGKNKTVAVLGFGCIFLNDQPSHKGNTQTVSGELLYECQANGGVNVGGTGPGLHTIILYKSFGDVSS